MTAEQCSVVIVGAVDPDGDAAWLLSAIRLAKEYSTMKHWPIPATFGGKVRVEASRRPGAARNGQARPTLDTELSGVERPAGQHDLVDYTEAARRLSLSVRTLRRRVQAGEIPAHRDGYRVLFRPRDLIDYAARDTTAGARRGEPSDPRGEHAPHRSGPPAVRAG